MCACFYLLFCMTLLNGWVQTSTVSSRNIKQKIIFLLQGIGGVVKTIPPFSKPLLLSLAGDLFAKASTASDETVHNFISRRLGAEVWIMQTSILFSLQFY